MHNFSLLREFCLLWLKGDFIRPQATFAISSNSCHLFDGGRNVSMFFRLNMPIHRYIRQSFHQNPLRSMGESGFTCLKDIAKLQRNRLTTTQGSSTVHTFLPEMYISLVSYIFDCGQCRALGPGMVIWISPARRGKLVGMLEICNVFFWKCVNHKQKKKLSGRLFPTQRRIFGTQRRLYATKVFVDA